MRPALAFLAYSLNDAAKSDATAINMVDRLGKCAYDHRQDALLSTPVYRGRRGIPIDVGESCMKIYAKAAPEAMVKKAEIQMHNNRARL